MKEPKEKPTAEKEQEKIDKTLEEAEKLKEDKKVKVKAVIDDIPDDPAELGKEEKYEESEKTEIHPEPKEEEKPVVESKKDPDYKEKFINSTKEAQILHAKNKKIMEAFEKSKGIPEPTEDELKKEYSDWDVMGDFEKKIAKDNMRNTKRFASFGEVAEEFTEIGKWQTKVDEFMGDPENISNNPLLEGKEAEFRAFASKPTRRGVDFDDLIGAFLFEESKGVKLNKGGMLPTGSAGDKTIKPKSDKLTVEQGRQLRMADYEKYKRYLLAGKIEEV